jgi:hypothetical protein
VDLAHRPTVRPPIPFAALFCIPATAAVTACGTGNMYGVPSSDRSGTTSSHSLTDGGGAASSNASPDAAPDAPSNAATFTLIDTSVTNDPTGSPLPGFDPIASGTVVNLQQTGQWVSLRANLPAGAIVGSAVFVLDGTYVHGDVDAPFTMCGQQAPEDAGQGADEAGTEAGPDAGTVTQFEPCPLTDGHHNLTLTLYAPQSQGGQITSVIEFEFGIVSSDYDGGVFNDMPDADAGDDDADATCCP